MMAAGKNQSSVDEKQRNPDAPTLTSWWSRIDIANIAPVAALIIGLAGFLWWAIDDVDDDVDRLNQRVDGIAANIQDLAKEVGYIRGHLSKAGIPDQETTVSLSQTD